MALRIALWGSAAVLAGGCGGQPFPGSAESLDELGQAVLSAFAAGDRAALERYRLTEAEHNGVVWPEQPASQGDNPFPLDLAWRNIQLRNQRAVRRAAAALAAVRREGDIAYERVDCEGGLRAFQTFSVHTGCYVRFSVAGRRYKMQLFKDVLVRHGGYKIFRYYDEDPEQAAES